MPAAFMGTMDYDPLLVGANPWGRLSHSWAIAHSLFTFSYRKRCVG